MSKRKKNSKLIAFALVIGIITFTFNSLALAGTIATNEATSTHLWRIHHYIM